MTWFATASPRERYHAIRGVLTTILAVAAAVFIAVSPLDIPWFANLIVLFFLVSAGMQFYLSYSVRKTRLEGDRR